MAEIWMRTDPAQDVASSIRHVLRAAIFVGNDPLAWKWVMLALHAALQGACVCHLTTTAEPVGALTRQSTRKWLAYFENSRTESGLQEPEVYLMSFQDLLKSIRKPNSAGGGDESSDIQINDSELARLCRFHHEIRNRFVHFQPMTWSIDVSGVPDIANLVARIIADIMRSGWAFRNLEPVQISELNENLRLLAGIGWTS